MIRTWQCVLAYPHRTAIVEAYDWLSARDIAAELFGTQRIHDVKVTEVKPVLAEMPIGCQNRRFPWKTA